MNQALHMWVYKKYRYYIDMLKNALVKMKGQFQELKQKNRKGLLQLKLYMSLKFLQIQNFYIQNKAETNALKYKFQTYNILLIMMHDFT